MTSKAEDVEQSSYDARILELSCGCMELDPGLKHDEQEPAPMLMAEIAAQTDISIGSSKGIESPWHPSDRISWGRREPGSGVCNKQVRPVAASNGSRMQVQCSGVRDKLIPHQVRPPAQYRRALVSITLRIKMI